MNIPGFRLHYKNPQIADVSNAQKSNANPAFQKNLPYLHTEKGKDQISLNGVVPFEGQDDIDEVDKETILCRHFSAVLGLNALARPDGKIVLSAVDSPEHIAASIKKEAEQQFLRINANSNNLSAFDNDNFADFLKAQFWNMERQPSAEGDALAVLGDATHEAGNDKVRHQKKGIKTFLIQSTNHAMLLRLRLKEKEGVPVYVVSFYDPNRTACLVRCEVSDLAELGKIAGSHSLAAFINPMVDGQADTEDYKNYFPQNTAEIALAIEVPQPGAAMLSEMQAAGRKLQRCDCKLSPTLMFHLMTVGLPGSIDEMTASFNETRTAPTRDLLEAKRADGIPGLHIALETNQAEVIGAWGKLLALLPDDTQRITMLEAKNSNETPGLFMALQNNHAEAIAVWGKLLALLPNNTQRGMIIRGLLEAKNADEIPGLCIALQNNQAEAIAAWGELLALLPDDARSSTIRDLLEAKHTDETPGLHIALENNNAEAIAAWGKLLALLPDDARSTTMRDLMEAKDANATPGLHMALENNYAEAIAAWGKLLTLLPNNAQRSMIIQGLLEAKNANGAPGLYWALHDGQVEAIKMWGNLLSTLPRDTPAKEMAKLIFAVCDDGNTAFEALLEAEDEETSSAWQALLAYLPASAANLKAAAIAALSHNDPESKATLDEELDAVLTGAM